MREIGSCPDVDFRPFAAARAEMMARNGEFRAAEQSYAQAIEQCTNPVERAHLERRRAEVVETRGA